MNKLIKIVGTFIVLITIIIVIPVDADSVISKYNYVINYYIDEINKDNLIETIIGREDYNKEIVVDTNYKIPEGYKYDGEEVFFNIKELDNEINVVYTKKNNLSYCVNYFYDGIIFINNTECFYEQTYGKKITSFTDKPREGYVFESFDEITVLDIEENIMNVHYKKASSEEIGAPNTSISFSNIRYYFIKLLRTFLNIIH